MQNQYNEPIKSKNIFLILFSQGIGIIVSFIVLIAGLFTDLAPALTIIASLISGASVIYPLVMMTIVSKEINIMCDGDGEHLMPYICAVLLGCVTLGIYYIYYLYRMQTRLRENSYRYNVSITESGGSIILWYLLLLVLFGVGPIVSLAIIIKNFNKMVYGFNRRLTEDQYHQKKDYGSSAFGDTIGTQGVLRCVGGVLTGASIVLNDGETVVLGRDPRNANLIIDDTKVSRVHCSITYDAGSNTFVIVDNSRNGIILGNGQKLETGKKTRVFCKTEFILADRNRFVVDMKNNNYTI